MSGELLVLTISALLAVMQLELGVGASSGSTSSPSLLVNSMVIVASLRAAICSSEAVTLIVMASPPDVTKSPSAVLEVLELLLALASALLIDAPALVLDASSDELVACEVAIDAALVAGAGPLEVSPQPESNAALKTATAEKYCAHCLLMNGISMPLSLQNE